MNKLLSLTLLAVGVILIAYSIQASDSIGSDISRLFTGSPTDKTIWLLVGGGIASAIGVGGLMFRSKAR